MLTLPHHTSSRTSGSSTTRLSVGLRPVFLPEYAISAPVDEMVEPFSNLSAASCRNAGDALRCTSVTEMPCFSSENAMGGAIPPAPGSLIQQGGRGAVVRDRGDRGEVGHVIVARGATVHAPRRGRGVRRRRRL